MIYVIEPHADDAFLSLGGHIEKWVKDGQLVTIVTVFSGTRKRARDAEAYAKAVGALWVGLGAIEGFDSLQLVQRKMSVFIRGRDYGAQYFVPAAVSHPEHMLVRDAFEKDVKNLAKGHLSYYLDQPYASMPKHSDATCEALRGLWFFSFLKPHARKYRHIPLFKDQAKFFHFNPAEKLKHNVEVIFQ